MPLGRKEFQLLKKDIPLGKVEIYLENSMMGDWLLLNLLVFVHQIKGDIANVIYDCGCRPSTWLR